MGFLKSLFSGNKEEKDKGKLSTISSSNYIPDLSLLLASILNQTCYAEFTGGSLLLKKDEVLFNLTICTDPFSGKVTSLSDSSLRSRGLSFKELELLTVIYVNNKTPEHAFYSACVNFLSDGVTYRISYKNGTGWHTYRKGLSYTSLPINVNKVKLLHPDLECKIQKETGITTEIETLVPEQSWL